jgi:hypothetical protein
MLKEGDNLEDLEVDDKMKCEGVDWIPLIEDRDMH